MAKHDDTCILVTADNLELLGRAGDSIVRVSGGIFASAAITAFSLFGPRSAAAQDGSAPAPVLKIVPADASVPPREALPKVIAHPPEAAEIGRELFVGEDRWLRKILENPLSGADKVSAACDYLVKNSARFRAAPKLFGQASLVDLLFAHPNLSIEKRRLANAAFGAPQLGPGGPNLPRVLGQDPLMTPPRLLRPAPSITPPPRRTEILVVRPPVVVGTPPPKPRIDTDAQAASMLEKTGPSEDELAALHAYLKANRERIVREDKDKGFAFTMKLMKNTSLGEARKKELSDLFLAEAKKYLAPSSSAGIGTKPSCRSCTSSCTNCTYCTQACTAGCTGWCMQTCTFCTTVQYQYMH